MSHRRKGEMAQRKENHNSGVPKFPPLWQKLSVLGQFLWVNLAFGKILYLGSLLSTNQGSLSNYPCTITGNFNMTSTLKKPWSSGHKVVGSNPGTGYWMEIFSHPF